MLGKATALLEGYKQEFNLNEENIQRTQTNLESMFLRRAQLQGAIYATENIVKMESVEKAEPVEKAELETKEKAELETKSE